MEAVTGVIDDISDAVDNLGVTQTVSGLMGSLSAMKGSVTSLINQPAMLASSLMGGRCPAFHRYAIPGQHFPHGTVWRSDSNVAMLPPQADRGQSQPRTTVRLQKKILPH
ncbi:putative DNA circulation protein [Escherichia coli]|uniref:Putative DNA circulation protein n=1 Tax=Escherichia coli TaxID=562 RepID=A0A2X3JGU9_ECOLX|nr:putative DNA circulation protein [Escherichia coli]